MARGAVLRRWCCTGAATVPPTWPTATRSERGRPVTEGGALPCRGDRTAGLGARALALRTTVCTTRTRVVELAHRPTGAGIASEVT